MSLTRFCLAILIAILAAWSTDVQGQNRRPRPRPLNPIHKQCPNITVHPATLANGRLSRPYQRKLTATPAGGNYSFAVSYGNLPSGLTLNANGLLSGTPTANGTFNFRVTASGFGACSATGTYTMNIGPD